MVMATLKKSTHNPAFNLEKEAVQEEIESGLQSGVDILAGKVRKDDRVDNYHNTKYLLKQYRRVAYAVKISEAELNIRMEMEHGTKLSTLEMNAELAGIDLSGTKLESHTRSVIRSKKMLEIIKTTLEAVRGDPERGELLYYVLYQTYFTEKKPRNREQIILELDRLGFPMSVPSYHNYLKAAIKAIDRILWGYTARDCIELIKQFLPE